MPKAKVRWKKDRVLEIAVKGDVSVIAQMLDEPYLQFYNHFFSRGQSPNLRLTDCSKLFCCSVTRQFLQQSLVGDLSVPTNQSPPVPRLRIAQHPGSRLVSVWKGTQSERRFVLLGEKAGGSLIEYDPLATGAAANGTVLKNLDTVNFDETSGIELAVVWTFPLLNERLHLIHTLGIAVDPLKEIVFEQQLRPEYEIFVNIVACHGKLSEWGYQER
jgi:hypothetical protein